MVIVQNGKQRPAHGWKAAASVGHGEDDAAISLNVTRDSVRRLTAGQRWRKGAYLQAQAQAQAQTKSNDDDCNGDADDPLLPGGRLDLGLRSHLGVDLGRVSGVYLAVHVK